MQTCTLPPLPAEWVDRLFGRLNLRYGNDWLRMWEGLDLMAVKSDWANQLAGMHLSPGGQNRLRYGIENLPDRPPNATAFRAICSRAPEHAVPQLPPPTANRDLVEQVRAKLRDAFRGPKDPMAWAHALKARHEAGERLTPAQIDAYRGAFAAPLEWVQ